MRDQSSSRLQRKPASQIPPLSAVDEAGEEEEEEEGVEEEEGENAEGEEEDMDDEDGEEEGEEEEWDDDEDSEEDNPAAAALLAKLKQQAEVSSNEEESDDDEDWEEELKTKIELLRKILGSFDPLGNDAVNLADEEEISLFLRKQRGVATWRVVDVLSELCAFAASLKEPDRPYVPPSDSQPNDSQQSTDSQLDIEMLEDPKRDPTPQWLTSTSRSGQQRLDEPPSLKRLRAPPGSFGSPLRPSPLGEPRESGHCRRPPPAPLAPKVGRPSTLADEGHSTQDNLKRVSAIAHNAPGKAKALFTAQREAAPQASGHPNIVAKSRAATKAIFEGSGSLNEVIEVVAHVLQREEMRPIIEHLGHSTTDCSVDSLIVDSMARFVEEHVDSSFRDLGSRSGGTRSTDAQAAHQLLGKSAGSQELIDEWKIKAAAKRLGYRVATFSYLVNCRLKMDKELEHDVEYRESNLLKVSRLRRKDAADDDAQVWDDWSHRTCRYDSTQTTGGKKVRRFDDTTAADGKVRFEEHERRTLPCSRLELCNRFLDSDEYKAFLAKNEVEPRHVSFFQKRVCSCMVDEKMTQCADSIDTQFNILFKTWLKAVQGWFDDDTCDIDDCVCKELGFFEIETSKDLWAFLFRDDCAPKPDPTRALPRDIGEHTQLAYDCVSNLCDEVGCMKDKLARWAICPVMNKVTCLSPSHACAPAQAPIMRDQMRSCKIG